MLSFQRHRNGVAANCIGLNERPNELFTSIRVFTSPSSKVTTWTVKGGPTLVLPDSWPQLDFNPAPVKLETRIL